MKNYAFFRSVLWKISGTIFHGRRPMLSTTTRRRWNSLCKYKKWLPCRVLYPRIYLLIMLSIIRF
jgi:hypothetical protein